MIRSVFQILQMFENSIVGSPVFWNSNVGVWDGFGVSIQEGVP